MLERAVSLSGAGLALTLLLVGFAAPIQAQTSSCTLSQGYWKNHPDAWPRDSITIDGLSLPKDPTLLGLLSTPPRGDASYILVRQFIAAELNVASGAPRPVVDSVDVLDAASAWLDDFPPGSRPSGADRADGLLLASLLDAFNNGQSPCDDAPPPPDDGGV